MQIISAGQQKKERQALAQAGTEGAAAGVKAEAPGLQSPGLQSPDAAQVGVLFAICFGASGKESLKTHNKAHEHKGFTQFQVNLCCVALCVSVFTGGPHLQAAAGGRGGSQACSSKDEGHCAGEITTFVHCCLQH